MTKLHVQILAASGVAFVLAFGANAYASPTASACAPQLRGFDRRLYDKAGEGTDALRRFISIRRSFVQNDVAETAIWAANLRAAEATLQRPSGCGRRGACRRGQNGRASTALMRACGQGGARSRTPLFFAWS